MTLGNILTLLVIGMVFYMITKKGGGCCGGHDNNGREGSGSNKETDHADHHLEIETSKIGTEKDPVCGMKVKNNLIVSRHQGTTFPFCSEQCRKLFELNPNKYARA